MTLTIVLALLAAPSLAYAELEDFDLLVDEEEDARETQPAPMRDYQQRSVSDRTFETKRLRRDARGWLNRLPPPHILLGIILGVVGLFWTGPKNKSKPHWGILYGLSWLVLVVAAIRWLRYEGY